MLIQTHLFTSNNKSTCWTDRKTWAGLRQPIASRPEEMWARKINLHQMGLPVSCWHCEQYDHFPDDQNPHVRRERCVVVSTAEVMGTGVRITLAAQAHDRRGVSKQTNKKTTRHIFQHIWSQRWRFLQLTGQKCCFWGRQTSVYDNCGQAAVVSQSLTCCRSGQQYKHAWEDAHSAEGRLLTATPKKKTHHVACRTRIQHHPTDITPLFFSSIQGYVHDAQAERARVSVSV